MSPQHNLKTIALATLFCLSPLSSPFLLAQEAIPAKAIPVKESEISQWVFDVVHSSIGFSIAHMMVSKTRGTFNTFTGTLNFNEKEPVKSTVEVEIDAASIDTKNAKRDGHLKTPDFFDVEKFPKITFKSKTVTAGTEKGQFEIKGDLTMHGITKEIAFVGQLTDSVTMGDKVLRGFSATLSLDRYDFDLKYNKVIEATGVAVGQKVDIQLEIELNKK